MNKPRVIILYGSDKLAIQLHIDNLVEKMDDKSNASMNITRLDGKSLDFNELNTSVNTMSFLSDGRLVILSNTYNAFSSDKEKLLTLIESMPASTTLVLVESLDDLSPDSRRINGWMEKLGAAISSSAEVEQKKYSSPNDKSMTGWIINESRRQSELLKKQTQITQDAAGILAEMTGTDTRIASQEIGKLLEYVNYERGISEEDVLKVSAVSDQARVFDLVDAMGKGQGKQAQILLSRLIENQDPRYLWSMIIRQFRLILQAREVLDAGGGRMGIEKELGVHSYVAGKLNEQASQFKLPALERIYQHLLELEDDVRLFKMDLPLAMEILIAELSN
ncbi:MAG TPA: DNA polymerase III subunit delta [Anaerolineales bacterium]|nr:DNA polymerase III subunit delta [Anaerolineales bacterium]